MTMKQAEQVKELLLAGLTREQALEAVLRAPQSVPAFNSSRRG